jgi:hypothetical protein
MNTNVKILPPGHWVFINDAPVEFPPARQAIMRLYELWYAKAEPHVKTDNQEALRFLFQELTKKLRGIFNIPPHLQVISVRGYGFRGRAAGDHREVWMTIGIPEARQRLVVSQQAELARFLQQQDLGRRLQTPQAGDPRFGLAALSNPFREAAEKRLATAMQAVDKHDAHEKK